MSKWLIFLLISTTTLLLVGTNTNAENSDPSISRIDGSTLYETSALISSRGWDQADTVVIARGDRFSDALSGVPLAAKYDAPLLLSRSHRLDNFTKNELERLNARNVIILGGHLAIEDTVEDEIRNLNINVERLAGNNLHDTAHLVANEVAPNGSNKAIIVSDTNFQDALSIAPHAGSEGIPILLSERDSLPNATKQALDELNVQETSVIGGELAIEDNVLSDLPNPSRIEGTTRFHTNVEVHNQFHSNANKAYIATSERFPDGLSGAALASKQEIGVVLVRDPLHNVTRNHLISSNYDELFVLGGELAVNETTYNEIRSLFEDSNQTVFRLGDYHSKVAELREDLAQLEYQTSDNPENYYGSSTESAVTQFQRDNNLSVDGIAGPQTFSKLEELLSEQVTYGVVTASSLNVRSGPGTNYNVVGSLLNGTRVEILGTNSNGWHKISHNNSTGYVSGEYIRLETGSDKVVVIDAGHGGHDPGAQAFGFSEKDVILDVALIADEIMEDTNIDVVLTRDGDYFVELEDRVKMAHDSNADAFVSVHANAFGQEHVHGTETYWNQNQRSAESRALAESIQERLLAKLGTRDRGVKEADFYVIRNTQVPSVLVELGFITNREEANKMQTPEFKQAAAEAIKEGILNFYN